MRQRQMYYESIVLKGTDKLCRFNLLVGNDNDLKFYKQCDDIIILDSIIHDYSNRNFKSYYQRFLFDFPHVWIDYGSHSDFIYVIFQDQGARDEFENKYLRK